jgi:hypothetical protein
MEMEIETEIENNNHSEQMEKENGGIEVGRKKKQIQNVPTKSN